MWVCQQDNSHNHLVSIRLVSPSDRQCDLLSLAVRTGIHLEFPRRRPFKSSDANAVTAHSLTDEVGARVHHEVSGLSKIFRDLELQARTSRK